MSKKDICWHLASICMCAIMTVIEAWKHNPDALIGFALAALLGCSYFIAQIRISLTEELQKLEAEGQ